MTDTVVDLKPSFEDVLEAQLSGTSDRIWLGHDTQSPELRRILANAIGALVRDAYRGWHLRMRSYKELDNTSVDPMLLREPASPLDGVNLDEDVDPNSVEENTAQSDLVQHGPQFDTSGNLVTDEMRTISKDDLRREHPEDRPGTTPGTTQGNDKNESPEFGNSNIDSQNIQRESPGGHTPDAPKFGDDPSKK